MFFFWMCATYILAFFYIIGLQIGVGGVTAYQKSTYAGIDGPKTRAACRVQGCRNSQSRTNLKAERQAGSTGDTRGCMELAGMNGVTSEATKLHQPATPNIGSNIALQPM